MDPDIITYSRNAAAINLGAICNEQVFKILSKIRYIN